VARRAIHGTLRRRANRTVATRAAAVTLKGPKHGPHYTSATAGGGKTRDNYVPKARRARGVAPEPGANWQTQLRQLSNDNKERALEAVASKNRRSFAKGFS